MTSTSSPADQLGDRVALGVVVVDDEQPLTRRSRNARRASTSAAPSASGRRRLDEAGGAGAQRVAGAGRRRRRRSTGMWRVSRVALELLEQRAPSVRSRSSTTRRARSSCASASAGVAAQRDEALEARLAGRVERGCARRRVVLDDQARRGRPASDAAVVAELVDLGGRGGSALRRRGPSAIAPVGGAGRGGSAVGADGSSAGVGRRLAADVRRRAGRAERRSPRPRAGSRGSRRRAGARSRG